jgi:thiol-disulfide isomerase/thioredoxin
LKKVTVKNSGAVISRNYFRFVDDYVRHSAMAELKKDTSKKYEQVKKEFIEKNFSGELKEYLWTKWIYDLLVHENDVAEAKPLLEQYRASVSRKDYLEILENAYREAEKLAAGNPAPEFTFPDVNGKMVSLKSFRGKVVYLDIWASWCGPCRAEIPEAKKLEEEMKDKEIAFVCISVDADENAWKKIIKEKEMAGIHLLSKGNFNSEIARLYNVKGIPRYVIIDKNGNIVDSNAKRPSSGVKKDLEKLL